MEANTSLLETELLCRDEIELVVLCDSRNRFYLPNSSGVSRRILFAGKNPISSLSSPVSRY
jgi:hypothetical protein